MNKDKFMEEMDIQYKIATELIEEYHAGQVDMGGEPYINHLRAVFDKVWEMQHADKHWGYNDEDVMYAKAGITALLHDILEDTDCTEEILKERGIRQDIIDAVKFMTHDPSMSYFDYICTIETHPIARIVKICDLENNMDVRRLKSMTDGDLRRIRRYWAAWKYLKGEIGKTKAKNLMERK